MASTAMFAPYDPASAMARRIVAPITGNAYQIDPRGSALVDSSDVAWFQTQGFSATPTAATGQSLMYAPYMADEGMTGPTTNPNTGNTYFINAAGAVAVATADIAWFQTQGYALVPTPGTGFSLMSTQVEVGQALSGPIFSPITGNMYVMNGQGWIIAATADVAWLQGQGFAPVASGGVAPPIFPPVVGATQATIAADFAGQQYWASAASQASFAAWLTAIGGTYTRASSATYLQGGVVKTAAANAPRFPTDAGGVPQGIRLTGPATNQLIQSSNLTNAAWSTTTASLTVGAATAPDGVSGTNKIVATAVSANHYGFQPSSVALGAGSTTVSAFFHANEYAYGSLSCLDASNNNIYTVVIDIANAVVSATGTLGTPTGTSSSVQKLANGWVLASVTMATIAGNVYIVLGASPTAVPGFAGGYPSYLGNGVSGVDVWGSQLTNTAFPCDYIPTTTATVTQAADSFSFPFTQTTFSVLIGVGAGWPMPTAQNGMLMTVDPTTSFPLFIVAGGISIASYNGTTNLPASPDPTAGTAFKAMLAGSPAGRSITHDGIIPFSDANKCVAAAPATAYIANNAASNSYLNGNITQLAIWNGLVASAAEMQRLTT